MIRVSALVLLVLLSNAVRAEKPELGVSVEVIAPDEIDGGYLFWHQADELRTDVENITLLMDAQGKLIHRWETDLTGGGHTSHLLPSGGLLRMGTRDRSYVLGQPVAASDMLQITDQTGAAIWELAAKDLSLNDHKITFHHEAIPMPNGNVLVLIYEELSPQEASALGWSAGNGKRVWSDGIVELKPNLDDGSHEVVWVWRFVDHMVQDQNGDAPTHGVVTDHPRRIDGHFPKSYAPMNLVRQHLNSIDYHPELDQVMVSAFIYNEIWIIDHSTTTEQARGSTGGRWGKGGDLLFRYGNSAAFGQGRVQDRSFDKQHDANWIDNGLPGAGNILIFNNNTRLTGPLTPPPDGRSPRGAALAQEELTGISNVHEIQPIMSSDGSYAPPTGEGFNATQVWRWENKNFFAPFQGGARRLANGNTLLSDTVGRRVWEVNPAGEVVVRYKGPAPTFKAFKHSTDKLGSLLDE